MPRTSKNSHIVAPLRKYAVPIDSLNFDPENARRHSESNVRAVKEALRVREDGSGGQNQALVVQRFSEHHQLENVIRVGNCRVQAARDLGWPTVAAVVLDVDDAEAIRIALADNRAPEHGEWDGAALNRNLQMLADLSDVDTVQAYVAELGWEPDDFDLDAGLVEASNLTIDPAVESPAQSAPPTGERTAPSPSVNDPEANPEREIVLRYRYDKHAQLIAKFVAARSALEVETNSDVVEQLLDAFLLGDEA